MSFSSITVEQRDKEEKALRSFLWLYLVSSVVLHVLALAIGVIVPWNRVLAPEEEPIEVTMVEPLPQEAPKLKEEQPVSQPTTPLKQPETSPPEKVEERQPRPTEARRPVEEKVANRTTQNNQPATTARESQASPGGSVNPFKGLLGSGGGSGTGTEAGTGTGIETGSGSGGTGAGQGTGTGVGTGSGSGTGSGQGTGIGFGTGTGPGSGSGTGSGTGTGPGSGSGTAGSRGGGRAGTGIVVDKDKSLDGIRQEATAVVRDGKVVDFKFQSTGDAELDKQIRRQLDKFKKKVKLPSNVSRDGEIRANIKFDQAKDKYGKSLKRSRQAERYLERQARERQVQTTTRQSGNSTTSSVIQQGVDATTTYRTSPRSSTPSTYTPRRKVTVKKVPPSTPTSGSRQSTPSTYTPRRKVTVKKVPSTSTPPVQSAPSTTAPANPAPTGENE